MSAPVISASIAPLVAALEENLEGHMAFIARSAPGMRVFDDDDLLVVDSGLPSDTFNKVARARLSEPHADRRISEVVQYFQAVKHRFAWWVGPGSRPFDLEDRLRDHGFAAAEQELGMIVYARDLPATVELPQNFAVRRARTAREIADFAAVTAANWEPLDPAVVTFYTRAVPVLLADACPMQLFVGYLDYEPVAASELFTGGGVGGLYSVATRKEFRRRGFGSVMTWFAANAARTAGIAGLALQSSDDGKGVYARLGFQACCHFAEYTLW